MKFRLPGLCLSAAVSIFVIQACSTPAVQPSDVPGQSGSISSNSTISDNQGIPVAGRPAASAQADSSAAPLLQAGDYDKAISQAIAALNEAPDDGKLKEKLADAYIARAWYYKLKRLTTYTFSDLSRAVETAPSYYRAHYELGKFHNNQWQFSIGIFDFNKSLSLKPDFAPAYAERAYSYYKNQKYELGLADAARAIELAPSLPRPYCVRSLIYVATGKPELAEQDADTAVSLDPADAASYYNRSLVYTAAGKKVQAVADLEETLRLSQDEMLTQRARDDLQILRK